MLKKVTKTSQKNQRVDACPNLYLLFLHFHGPTAIYTYIYIYTHTHTHIYMYIYIYMHIYSLYSSILYLISYFILFYLVFLTCDALYYIHIRHSARGLSGKYAAILNISRTCRVVLMSLGIQSEKTLLRIREQSLSCGASQSAVRRR
jgi:hypothetical protein